MRIPEARLHSIKQIRSTIFMKLLDVPVPQANDAAGGGAALQLCANRRAAVFLVKEIELAAAALAKDQPARAAIELSQNVNAQRGQVGGAIRFDPDQSAMC